jgi:hypothetical protein
MAEPKAKSSDTVRVMVRVDVPETTVQNVPDIQQKVSAAVAEYKSAVVELTVLPAHPVR